LYRTVVLIFGIVFHLRYNIVIIWVYKNLYQPPH
jgi:hypothetical protein